jgi:hypothetical protein
MRIVGVTGGGVIRQRANISADMRSLPFWVTGRLSASGLEHHEDFNAGQNHDAGPYRP